MKMIIKCEKCKSKFEHYTHSHKRSGGPQKRFCDICIRQNQKKR